MIDRPLWVRVGLWQIPTRALAMGFMGFSLLAAAAGVVAGVTLDPLFHLAGLMLFSAAWYWRCIQWMDSHKRWHE